jgi:DNA invertase Pin-like site-specific DNA recombinase
MTAKKSRNYLVTPLTEEDIPAFVIYVRKSTEESTDKQKASIPQQIETCYKYVQKEHVVLAVRPKNFPIEQKTIEEILEDNRASTKHANELIAFYTEYWVITERDSAKTAFERKVWRNTIDLVNQGKIRGLLGYSPDRFSRNLQEGGELIQLVDNKYVALRFTNFHFENNAAGQMMLGFWFVFAEHYSKALRESVLRGVEKKHVEGRAIGTRKFGYLVDGETDRFFPDPKHFPILQKAFKRKLYDNWSDGKIVEEMNSSGWCQVLKQMEAQDSSINVKKISGYGLWSDTFYYGSYTRVFKGVEVKTDLRQIMDPAYQFVPLISEDEWYALQEKLSNNHAVQLKASYTQRTKRLDPLKAIPQNMLYAGDASEKANLMIFTLPNAARFHKKQAGGRTLEEVVEPHQIRYKTFGKSTATVKEITWDVIDKKVATFFAKIRVSEEDYQAYLYAVKEQLDNSAAIRASELNRLTLLANQNASKEAQFLKGSNYGVGLGERETKVWSQERDRYARMSADLDQRKKLIRKDQEITIQEKQDFVRTIQNLSAFWKRASYVQKHRILELTCLNIIVNDKKQLRINILPELESLFILRGGPTWI